MKYFGSNLETLRLKKGLRQYEMSDRLGFERTTWGNYERGKSFPKLEDFFKIAKYFGVSESDLLNVDMQNVQVNAEEEDAENTKNVQVNVKPIVQVKGKSSSSNAGESRMPLVVTMDTSGRENVVLVPVKARAGYLTGYGDPKFIESLPTYSFPALKTGTYRAFEVDGHSNHPTLSPKDLVICSNVDQLRDIKEGELHVFVTKSDGIVVKRPLFDHLNPDEIILQSDNFLEYSDTSISAKKVLEVWRCVGLFTRDLHKPTYYELNAPLFEARLTKLERRLADLPKKLK